MSAATISRPHSASPPAVAAPVPRYSSGDAPRVAALSLVPPSSGSDGDEIGRWVDEGGRFAPERVPVAALALVTPAS
jgi:hypothetical protein